MTAVTPPVWPGEVASMVSILLIVGTRFYREGLAEALGREASIRVVGTATAAADALTRLQSLAPDVVLLDTRVAGMLDLVRTLVATSPSTPVVALALPEHDSEVLACTEAGASGYVTEDASVADLVAIVQGVARGEMRCSPRITGTLLRRVAALATGHHQSPPLRRLTARELEVLQLLDEGLSNKQIARRLRIEVATVKNHVHHILEKLQVDRRAEATAYLRRQFGARAPDTTATSS
jgi:two-component system, NarL family, nitrate/nitrite response regulator NarL